MYPSSDHDITFVMEDGKGIGKAEDGSFEVNARIVINKKSLLNIIRILNNPPIENDYSEDILSAIENGLKTKKRIMDELKICETTYEKYIQLLKMNCRIKYVHRKWELNA